MYSFKHNTGIGQTERRTDGRTDGWRDGQKWQNNIALCMLMLCMLARAKIVNTIVIFKTVNWFDRRFVIGQCVFFC